MRSVSRLKLNFTFLFMTFLSRQYSLCEPFAPSEKILYQ